MPSADAAVGAAQGAARGAAESSSLGNEGGYRGLGIGNPSSYTNRAEAPGFAERSLAGLMTPSKNLWDKLVNAGAKFYGKFQDVVVTRGTQLLSQAWDTANAVWTGPVDAFLGNDDVSQAVHDFGQDFGHNILSGTVQTMNELNSDNVPGWGQFQQLADQSRGGTSKPSDGWVKLIGGGDNSKKKHGLTKGAASRGNYGSRSYYGVGYANGSKLRQKSTRVIYR
jgi:hypothetical protein